MSLCKSGLHLVNVTLPDLMQRHRWCCVHHFHLFPQSWNSEDGCSSFRLYSLLFLWLSRSSCKEEEKVWLRRAGMWLSTTGSHSCVSLSLSFFSSSFFRTQQKPSLRLPWSWFDLQGSNGILKLRERDGISCWKQLSSLLSHHPLSSCSFRKIEFCLGIPSSNLHTFQSLSKLFWDPEHFRPLGQRPPPAGSSSGSVCRDVVSPLWCCYLVWTSSSLSQLGSGWPIL